MIVLSPESIRKLDSIAIHNLGISGIVLMENAATGAVKEIYNFLDSEHIESAVIVAGKGNNGGDGFAIARKLYNKGSYIDVILLYPEKEIKGDAKTNLDILKNMKVNVHNIRELTGDEVKTLIEEKDIVIDAIFGTGFKGKIKGNAAKVVETINECANLIVSVDVPSGVNAATGEVEGAAILADLTVTMGFAKTGFFFYPGRGYVGDLKIIDIGIPLDILPDEDVAFFTMDRDIVRNIMPMRIPDSHKGTYGKVLIVAGSRGYTGAATLTSLSTLRAGCGLSYLACPSSLNPILEEKLTEVITIPAEDKGKGRFIPESVSDIMKVISDMDVVVIGPGISRNKDTEKFEMELLSKIPPDKPIVIDADGVNNLNGHLDILKKLKNRVILTPHLGEFSRITGISIEEIKKNTLKVVKNFVTKYNVVLVLKSATTVIGSKNGVIVNITGTSGLASGGTGDVLTGLIAGFLVQNRDFDDVSVAGLSAYIHGKAGEICAKEKTAYSMIAGDLLNCVPEAIKELWDGTE